MVGNSIFPLRLDGACVTKGGQRIIGPIDLELGGDGFTIVMGPNGAGKTTLLKLMHGMERVSEGSVSWHVPPREAHKRQSYIFQTPIIMRRSVLENIAYPLRVHGVGRRDALDQARVWAARVGLEAAANRQASVLSGGERQKLAVARALIRKPQVLFLDEPCANLDGRAMREIEDILTEAHRGGTRMVMATHHIGQARRLATDVLFIHRGKVHESGTADAFFRQPQTPEVPAFINGEIVE